MLVTFDIDLLTNKKLDAHQLAALYLIKENEIDRLVKYLTETNKLDQFVEEDLDKLHSMGLLHGNREDKYDLKHLQVTQDFISFISGGDIFQELVESYPRYVTRPDGNVDYLLTDLSKVKFTYIKLTQNSKALHEHILRCLKEEIDDRESNDSMKFMRRLPNWISDRGWETYNERVGHLQSVNGNSEFGYGQTVE